MCAVINALISSLITLNTYPNRNISRVSNQNGVSLLYIMLEIHHSGREPSNLCKSYICVIFLVEENK